MSESKNTIEELSRIKYVAADRAMQLVDGGVETIEEVAEMDAEELQETVSIGGTDAARIMESANKLSDGEEDSVTADERSIDNFLDLDGDEASAENDYIEEQADPATALTEVQNVTKPIAGVMESIGIGKVGNLAMVHPDVLVEADNVPLDEDEAVETILDAADQSGLEAAHIDSRRWEVTVNDGQGDVPLDDYLNDHGRAEVEIEKDTGSALTSTISVADDREEKRVAVVSYESHAEEMSPGAFNELCGAAMSEFQDKHGYLPDVVGMPAGANGQAEVQDWLSAVQQADPDIERATFAVDVDEDADMKRQDWSRAFGARDDALAEWADGIVIVATDRDADDCYVGKYIGKALEQNIDFAIGEQLDE